MPDNLHSTVHVAAIGDAIETRILGPGYFLLAVAGGLSGALSANSPVGALVHGVLMTFFVVIPGLLGGLGNTILPTRMPSGRMRLRGLNIAALAVLGLSLGLMTAASLAGPAGAIVVACALALWCMAMLSLATVLIASILENLPAASGLDALPWSLLCGAASLSVIVPVIAAALTRAALGDPAPLVAALGTMPLPAIFVGLAPACGIAADLLGADRVPRWAATSLRYALGLMSAGAATIWAHALMVHGSWSAIVSAGTIVSPVLIAAGTVLAAAWHRPLPLSLALAWISAALILMVVGWLAAPAAMPHSALVFGLVCATFAGLYLGLDRTGRVAGPLAWPQFILTMAGIAATLVPALLPEPLGGAAMSMALVLLVPIVLHAFGPATQAAPLTTRYPDAVS